MGLRIATNVASLAAQRQLSMSTEKSSHSMQALASGNRIVTAGDDPAGLAISENLRGQISSLQQAKQNSQDAAGLVQVAEGSLNEQNNILVRLRELAVQSSSDTVEDSERGYLNTEYQQMTSELDRIAEGTRYGAKKLLVGTNDTLEFQVGPGSNPAENVITMRMKSDTRASALGISGLSIDDKSGAREALDAIDQATGQVLEARAGFGALQGRLNVATENLELQGQNVSEARSRIADTDIAQETAELAQRRVQQDVGVAVLAQANADPERALRLL